jgi:protein-glutamine gamma-glutamyltransferase
MMSRNNNITTSAALPARITVVICSLPHFLNISEVATLVCLTIWCYQAFSLRHHLPVPGLLLRTVAGAVLLAMAVGLNGGITLKAFVTLLIFMISLKTFELRTKRDCIVTIILSYFLVFSSMLFNDSIFVFAYLVLSILCITAALIAVNFPRSSPKQALSLAGKLSLQAIPFMVVFFLLFPRIQGGLWGRPPGLSSISGFADRISLNTISKMAQSKKTEFRASFSGNAPGPEQLYWRGIVLSHFDGVTWKEAKGKGRVPRGDTAKKEKIVYTVTLEPHNHRRLFALDLPVRVSAPRTRGRSDYTWVMWRPSSSRLQYTAESLPDASPPAVNPYDEEYLQLPEAVNTRTRLTAARWRSESDSDKAYIDRVIRYFQTNNFTYTLDPETVPPSEARKNAIDSFLFGTREGFCEHYASAFAFLMRAGGIPVRLVAGYLGGEVNPYGDYMVIRQSDAHVWCEVFIDGETWQRIDPTIAAAPARISRSLTADLASGNIVNTFISETKAISTFLKALSDYSDLVNSRWNNWVLGYSRSDQIQLFQWMGMDLRLPGGVFKALFLTMVLLAACGFIALAFMRKMISKGDKVTAKWQNFCVTMAKIGIPRPVHQGPMAYAQCIIDQRPDLEPSISEIAHLYAQLRFNPECAGDALPRFTKALKSFSPQLQD